MIPVEIKRLSRYFAGVEAVSASSTIFSEREIMIGAEKGVIAQCKKPNSIICFCLHPSRPFSNCESFTNTLKNNNTESKIQRAIFLPTH
jgi:hypothetical protein